MSNFLNRTSFCLIFLFSSLSLATHLEPVRLETEKIPYLKKDSPSHAPSVKAKQKVPKALYIESTLATLKLPLDSKILMENLQRLVLEKISSEDPVYLRGQKLEMLYKLGKFRAVLRHLSSIPEKEQSPQLMENVFLAMCFEPTLNPQKMLQIASRFYTQTQSEFWHQAVIFADALSKNTHQAELSLNLIRDQENLKDSQFLKLMDHFLYKQKIEELAPPTLIDLAIARSTGVVFPKTLLETTSLPLSVAIIFSDHLLLEARIEAAEKALDSGAIEAETLALLYNKMKFPENLITATQKNNGLISQKLLSSSKRALLFQAAKRSAGQTRAEILTRFWKHDNGISYSSLTQVSYPLLKELIPDDELSWFAPDAFKALVLFPENQHSKAWISLTEKESPELWLSISPLLYLSHASTATDIDEWFIKWFHVKNIQDPSGIKEKALLLANLLTAVGKPIKLHTLRDLEITFMSSSHPGILESLYSKSQESRSLEEVIVSAAKKISKAKSQRDWIKVSQAVGKLTQFGLPREASRLAIEIALKMQI